MLYVLFTLPVLSFFGALVYSLKESPRHLQRGLVLGGLSIVFLAILVIYSDVIISHQMAHSLDEMARTVSPAHP